MALHVRHSTHAIERMTSISHACRGFWTFGRIFKNHRILSCSALVRLHSQHQIPSFGPLNMDTVDTTKRLAKLRSLMKSHDVDIYGNGVGNIERMHAE